MQIVIDIPEDEYNIVKYGQYGNINIDIVRKAIAKGTPLPKGHGRLVDADAILEEPSGNTYIDLNIAEVIIDADKAESEGK